MTAAGADGQVLLRCEHVSVRRGGREVVRNVSAELRRGEIVALLGPNGAGKSTLLDALAGALVPAQGQIERHGRVAIALQSPDLARRTGACERRARARVVGCSAQRASRPSARGVALDRRRAPRSAPGGGPVRR